MLAPFDLSSLAGSLSYGLIFLVIGMGFGAVLEMAGFGDSRKLSAQFYLRDMTVLKVMFTAIVVACVLIFLCASFELLDFSRLWVNPTYLLPGVLGGLIMGVGFIVGGFCPGTSLVAASTFKLDGILFVLGALAGVYLFGESVGGFEEFWLSTFLGRFILPEWLHLPAGVVVLLVVLMALAMFYAAEICELFFGARKPWREILLRPRHARHLVPAGLLVAASLLLVWHGQPGADARWARLAAHEQPRIDRREIFVHPAEVVSLRNDPLVRVGILDLRPEREFNLFHVAGSERVEALALEDPALVRRLSERPDNEVTLLAGNGEGAALAAWKRLRAQSIGNLYVIEGGINHWLELYPPPTCVAERSYSVGDAELSAYRFAFAAGSSLPSAQPENHKPPPVPCAVVGADTGSGAAFAESRWPEHAFTKKVTLQTKKIVKGGCG